MPRRKKYYITQPFGTGSYEFYEVIKETDTTLLLRQVEAKTTRTRNPHRYHASPTSTYTLLDEEDDTSYNQFRIRKTTLDHGKYSLYSGKPLEIISPIAITDTMMKFKKMIRD